MAGTHSVTRSFLNVRDTPVYTLVFKWSCHTQSQTGFQMVGRHPVDHSFLISQDTRSYTRFQMVWSHPIKHSFSFSQDTPSYQLVFQIADTHPFTHSISNDRETRGFTLVVKWLGHTRLLGRF